MRRASARALAIPAVRRGDCERPTVVGGGGRAGVTAAAELARAGGEVTLFESAQGLGGGGQPGETAADDHRG